ncbi:hypothetical protein FAZ15_15930 [Sphingobacterium olei]|uniref:WD40 repeat domain-containing protein n=1 Tax=Sphingobacterium olei TaxID=2571155 RepID=A0A4U0NKP5_9SPHI|nr:DUF6528 family protein [Sphingobacterium olei]TJZ54949.1 hypothetical protein FAZ15_15930 [Sphingobacterium olei]
MRIIIFLLLFPTSLFAQRSNILQKDYLIACGDDKVIIIDPAKSTEANPFIVWQWRVAEATDLPVAYQKLMATLDECKPVLQNKKLLLTSSGGATILLDIDSKKVTFYGRTPMAHSADVLPQNRIAVANSTHPTGNSLEIYDINTPEKVIFKDSLYSGHGVVWNEKKDLLYVLGHSVLKAYALSDWKSSNPTLKLVKQWALPDEGGHDLSMIDPDNFVVSTHHNVFKFNTKKETFDIFSPLSGKHNIKSVNYDQKNDKLVYTIAEQSWWTHHIYSTQPEARLHIPNIKIYKVRVVK